MNMRLNRLVSAINRNQAFRETRQAIEKTDIFGRIAWLNFAINTLNLNRNMKP